MRSQARRLVNFRSNSRNIISNVQGASSKRAVHFRITCVALGVHTCCFAYTGFADFGYEKLRLCEIVDPSHLITVEVESYNLREAEYYGRDSTPLLPTTV
jgi:hypothetical protein